MTAVEYTRKNNNKQKFVWQINFNENSSNNKHKIMLMLISSLTNVNPVLFVMDNTLDMSRDGLTNSMTDQFYETHTKHWCYWNSHEINFKLKYEHDSWEPAQSIASVMVTPKVLLSSEGLLMDLFRGARRNIHESLRNAQVNGPFRKPCTSFRRSILNFKSITSSVLIKMFVPLGIRLCSLFVL